LQHLSALHWLLLALLLSISHQHLVMTTLLQQSLQHPRQQQMHLQVQQYSLMALQLWDWLSIQAQLMLQIQLQHLQLCLIGSPTASPPTSALPMLLKQQQALRPMMMCQKRIT
jgi:hypothetical protein